MATMVRPGVICTLNSSSHLKNFPLSDSTSINPKLREFGFSHRNVNLKQARNASLVPVIRAQSSPDYYPDSKFYRVEAILSFLEYLSLWGLMVSNSFLNFCCFSLCDEIDHGESSALLKIGIRGVTICDVQGFGAQGGSKERQGGSEFAEDNYVTKVKMEIVVSKNQVEAVVSKIIEEARTGEIGDGKIFLVPISDILRVRSGERGEKAEKMTGGRSDTVS